jgi:hypothetical protein
MDAQCDACLAVIMQWSSVGYLKEARTSPKVLEENGAPGRLWGDCTGNNVGRPCFHAIHRNNINIFAAFAECLIQYCHVLTLQAPRRVQM